MTAARGAGRTVDRLLAQPRTVLAVLAGAQIAATLALAGSATHNGWVYFQGGDQIVNTTTGWLLGRLELPPTEIGYLWPLVQVPITWVTGPTFTQALPPIVLLDVLVLGPVALLCVYGIASRIGGRLLGYWAAALWVVAPFAVIPLFIDRYHEKWIDQFLPQALGLTAMPDYPSMVLTLVASYFVVRSLDTVGFADAVLAGLLAGAAGGLKPANYLFAAGAILAYPFARRWREGVAFAAALVPSLLVLALWKERGLGEIPVIALQQMQLAAASAPMAIDFDLGRYLELDVDHWREQMGQLREVFFSARLAQFVPFAGLLAVVRVRRGAIAAMLAGWLAAFLVAKGFSTRASIETNTFWRLLMPAWPAYLLLFASIPLLVPTLPTRLGPRVQPRLPAAPVAVRWLAVAAVLGLLAPTALTAASQRIEPPTPIIVQESGEGTTIPTPVDDSVELRAERTASGVRLTWPAKSYRADVFYRVYRADGVDTDTQCALSNGEAWSCFFRGTELVTTRETTFEDAEAPEGAVYRIGVGANWVDDPAQGDIFVFSPPATAPP